MGVDVTGGREGGQGQRLFSPLPGPRSQSAPENLEVYSCSATLVLAMLEVEEERPQGDVGTDGVEVEVAPEVGP